MGVHIPAKRILKPLRPCHFTPLIVQNVLKLSDKGVYTHSIYLVCDTVYIGKRLPIPFMDCFVPEV
jgi:hypothetical protein